MKAFSRNGGTAALLRMLAMFGLISPFAGGAARTPVILVSIDTLRADHLGCYGYRKLATPHLDAYAAGGTLFQNADAPIPLTLPSHLALFTSTYPFANGIEENAQLVPPGMVTLAAILKRAGYRTAAFIGSVFLEKELGIDQGFDLYDSPFRFTAFSAMTGSMFAGSRDRNPYSARESRPAALVTHSAATWLEAQRGEPVFAFLHLFDMHKPYHLPTGVSGPAGASLYDGQLAYVDRVLGEFRQKLVRSGLWDRSLVILTADHGEGLGEHGESSHGYFIYQSTLHVPLLVHLPAGSRPLPAVVRQPASLLDIAPTVLDLLGIPAPVSFAGRSLLKPDAAAVFAESLHTRHSFGWAPLYSLRRDNLKYIEAPRPELYDLAADPGELHNLVRSRPAEAVRLRSELAALLARYRPKGATPAPAVASRLGTLRSLGYLAPGPSAGQSASLADPKDRLREFHLYEKAMILLSDGDKAAAIQTLRQVLSADPRNMLARRDLAGVQLETGAPVKARLNLLQVLPAAPDDYVTLFLLGTACARLGRTAEATRYLEAACRLAPEAAQCRDELRQIRRQRESGN